MIRHDMPAAEYHAHVGLNASTLKAVARHPLAKVRYDLDHRVYKPTFDFGTAAHSVILERDTSSIVVVDADSWRTKAAQAQRDMAHAAGKTPMLDHEFAVVEHMCDAVMEHDVAREMLTGHTPEVSVFADVYGQPCKARLDAWHPDRDLIVDLKTTQDADPATFDRTAINFGYHLQMAHYQDVMEAETGTRPRFLFVLVEKAPPYLVSVVELAPDFADLGREMNHEAADTWARAVKDNHWPGYEGVSTVLMPTWAAPIEGE